MHVIQSFSKNATPLVENRVAHVLYLLKITPCIFPNIFLFNTPTNMSPSCTEINFDFINGM